MPGIKARYWLLTVPEQDFAVWDELPGQLAYLKGQKECGGTTGYVHWQLLAVFTRVTCLRSVKQVFGDRAHCEPSRSAAASDYVWKDDTSIEGTRFEKGRLPISRARTQDWDRVWDQAKVGQFEEIPKDILIRHYSSIKRIRVDAMQPCFRPEINVNVHWGVSGAGKTKRCWDEAGIEAYVKNPNTKWWDGYRGQKNVIIDEFVGRIDLSYLLLWFDKYPCIAEVKGYSVPLEAINFWVTSNIDPKDWYQDENEARKAALTRRLTNVTYHPYPYTNRDTNPTIWDEINEILLS